MKLTLQFDNQEESQAYLQGPNLNSLVYDFECWLRNFKHKELTAKETEFLDGVKKQWFSLKEEHKIQEDL